MDWCCIIIDSYTLWTIRLREKKAVSKTSVRVMLFHMACVCKADNELSVVHLLHTSSTGIAGNKELLMWLTKKNKQVMEPLYAFNLKSLLSPNAREKRLLRNADHYWWASEGIHFNFVSYYVKIVCGQPLIRLLLKSKPQYWWSNRSLGLVFVLQMTKQRPKQKCLHLIT